MIGKIKEERPLSTTRPPYEQDAPERFFVDDRCIGCMVCAEIAPETFLGQPHNDRVTVGRQPVGKEAITRCKEAREICPVDAISRQGGDRPPLAE